MIAAGIISATAAYAALSLAANGGDQTSFVGVFVQALIAGSIGLAVYAIVLLALRNEDILLFAQTAKSRFWKRRPLVVQGQQDL
jgi:hypothetical protein